MVISEILGIILVNIFKILFKIIAKNENVIKIRGFLLLNNNEKVKGRCDVWIFQHSFFKSIYTF